MRCKACDAILAEHDMYMREETGELEDLCVTCRKASQDDSDEINQEIDIEFGLIFERKTRPWDD